MGTATNGGMAVALCLLLAGSAWTSAQEPLLSAGLQEQDLELQSMLRLVDSKNPAEVFVGARRLYLAGELTALLDAVPAGTTPRWVPIALALEAGGLEVARDLIPYLGDKNKARGDAALKLLLSIGATEALIQSLHHSDPGVRKKARQGLLRMGQSCLPRLIEELRNSKRSYREEVFLILESMGLIAVREMALLLDDEAFFSRISPILIAHGHAGFKSLLSRWQRLDDQQQTLVLRQMKNRSLRSQRLLLSIVRFGPSEQACNAVRVFALQRDARSLVQALGLARRAVRARALTALQAMGTRAIPEITKALRDRDPELRFLALESLMDLGAPAHASLAGLLVDGDPTLRLEAVLFLIQAGEPGLEALGKVRAGTDGKSLNLLRPSLRKKRARLIPPLLESLDSKNLTCLTTSLEILRALEAWDELALSLRKTNPALIPSLRRALVRGGGAVVPALLGELSQADATSGPHCLVVLQDLGPQAIPILVEALADPKQGKQAASLLQQLMQPAGPRR